MLFWLYIVVMNCGYAFGTSMAPNLGQQNADINELVHQLINRTTVLETKLAAEVRMRENLEVEVQSKNDLTQFLRADVLRLNGTVYQEFARRQRLEANLATLTNRVDNLESSMTENAEIQAGLKSTIRRLNTSLSTSLASLQTSLHDVNQSLVTWEASRDADMTSLNATIIQNMKNITNVVSNISSLHGGLIAQMLKVDNVNITLLGVQYRLGQVEQSSANLNRSLASSKHTLKTFQQTIHDDVHQLNATLASQRSDRDVEERKLRTQINVLDARFMGTLTALNASLGQQKSTLDSQTTSLHQSVSQLQKTVAGNQAAIQSVSSMIQSGGSATPKPSASHNVMFSVSRLRSPLTPMPIFEKVITNVGAAFDPRHSLFTCPVSGNYLFTVSLQMSDTPTSPAQCWLRRNGSLVMSVFAQSLFPGTSASASNTVILQLTKGDRVDLSRCSGGPNLLPDSSTFSGVLIAVTSP